MNPIQGRLDVPGDDAADAPGGAEQGARFEEGERAERSGRADRDAQADAAADTESPDGLDFEQSMQRLEELVQQLEDGKLSLEESIRSFELGMRLVRFCAGELRRAERQVKELTEEAGRLRLADFEPEAE